MANYWQLPKCLSIELVNTMEHTERNTMQLDKRIGKTFISSHGMTSGCIVKLKKQDAKDLYDTVSFLFKK